MNDLTKNLSEPTFGGGDPATTATASTPAKTTGADLRNSPAGGGHPTHVTHLVFGLLFLGLVSAWAAFQAGLVDSTDLRWLVPLPWVIAGAVGLLAATLGNRRSAQLDAGVRHSESGSPLIKEIR